MKDRAYKIHINLKYNGYQRGLTRMVHNFFDKIPESEASVNEKLAKELHKPVIKKFKRSKFYATFRDNIWTFDLVEIRSLSSFNQNVKYLLCVIHVFNKYTWVKPFNDKKLLMVLLKE